jgi:deoxyribose-phosphate aldolase
MEINRMIDHTILKADATKDDVMKIIEEAKKISFLFCLHQSYMGSAWREGITR